MPIMRTPLKLDGKGRCCGRKAKFLKTMQGAALPHFCCVKCERNYDETTRCQIADEKWDLVAGQMVLKVDWRLVIKQIVRDGSANIITKKYIVSDWRLGCSTIDEETDPWRWAFHFTMPSRKRDQIIAWLKDRCDGHWFAIEAAKLRSIRVDFEDEEDVIKFKLTWVGNV